MTMMYVRKCGDIFMQFFMLKKWQWYSAWLCQMGIISIDTEKAYMVLLANNKRHKIPPGGERL